VSALARFLPTGAAKNSGEEAAMFHDMGVWNLACELARSGNYANVVMIEYELRRRGELSGEAITNSAYRRELLTRLCHAARSGEFIEDDRPARDPAIHAALC
jgi:hypothetical protein